MCAVLLIMTACGGGGGGGDQNPLGSQNQGIADTQITPDNYRTMASFGVQTWATPFAYWLLHQQIDDVVSGESLLLARKPTPGVPTLVPATCVTGSGETTVLDANGDDITFETGNRRSDVYDKCIFKSTSLEYSRHGTYQFEFVEASGKTTTQFLYAPYDGNYTLRHQANLEYSRSVLSGVDLLPFSTIDQSTSLNEISTLRGEYRQKVTLLEGFFRYQDPNHDFTVNALVSDALVNQSIDNAVRMTTITYQANVDGPSFNGRAVVAVLNPIRSLTDNDFNEIFLGGMSRITAEDGGTITITITAKDQVLVEVDFNGDDIVDKSETLTSAEVEIAN